MAKIKKDHAAKIKELEEKHSAKLLAKDKEKQKFEKDCHTKTKKL